MICRDWISFPTTFLQTPLNIWRWLSPISRMTGRYRLFVTVRILLRGPDFWSEICLSGPWSGFFGPKISYWTNRKSDRNDICYDMGELTLNETYAINLGTFKSKIDGQSCNQIKWTVRKSKIRWKLHVPWDLKIKDENWDDFLFNKLPKVRSKAFRWEEVIIFTR